MSAVQIIETPEQFKIQFRFHPNILEKVKRIPFRRWNNEDKTWYVPKESQSYVERFARDYDAIISTIKEEVIEYVIDPLPELTQEVKLKMDLFPYQRNGVAYGLEKERILIGDEPGLGKTGQSIAIVEGANAFPCLVECPNSLKENWKREWEKWTNRKVMILSNEIKSNYMRFYEAGLADVFIVNFESLKKYFVESIDKSKSRVTLKQIKFRPEIDRFNSVIIDESHRVKSFRAMQTKFTKGICNGKKIILELSGTPVINKPKDLIAQLGILDRMKDFGGYKNFVNRYCSGPNEASNLKELNYMLNKHCFFRREKSEVLKDLPAKMRQVVYCNIATRKEYTDAEANLMNYLREYKDADDEKIQRAMRGEIMVRIGVLKNISARGKLNDVFEFIDDIMASGEKLVVFAHLKDVIAAIKDRYPHAVSVTGSDSTTTRQFAIDRFQQVEDCQLIVCSIKAAGVGITLTASTRVAFVELAWHAADHDQCEDRCHRIGQKDSVTCTYFLGKDTIDEWNYEIIDNKRGIANAITGATDQVEENVIDNVISLFNQR